VCRLRDTPILTFINKLDREVREPLDLLDEMRVALADADCDRSHDDLRRCAGCGFFEQCDQAIEPADE